MAIKAPLILPQHHHNHQRPRWIYNFGESSCENVRKIKLHINRDLRCAKIDLRIVNYKFETEKQERV